MKEQFEYTLISPLSVSVAGKQETCNDVVVYCPKNSDSRWQLEFEHYVVKAVLGSAKLFPSVEEGKEKAKPDTDPTESEQEKSWRMIMVSCATPTEFRCMVNLLKDLMCSGNTEKPQATLGGTKFTKPLFDDLPAEDIKSLVGRYAYHFLSSDLI